MEMKNPSLPDDLLIEIFCRLPAKSAARCRCLSKSWSQYLSTSQFVYSQCAKINPADVAILVTIRNFHTTILEGDDILVARKVYYSRKYYQPVGTWNGLVLLESVNDFVVVNPLTLQRVTVNKYGHGGYESYGLEYDRFETHGFGYDRSSGEYKIVTVVFSLNDPSQFKTFVHVHSLKQGTWKRKVWKRKVYTSTTFYTHSSTHNKGVFFNGAIHWLAKTIKPERCVIAAFDVVTESFRSDHIPAPDVDVGSTIFASDGCLYIISTAGDMWMMKEYGKENSWTKFPRIFTPKWWRDHCSPMSFIRGNEVILANSGSLMVWNLTEGTTNDLIVDGSPQFILDGITFVESLVSPIQ